MWFSCSIVRNQAAACINSVSSTSFFTEYYFVGGSGAGNYSTIQSAIDAAGETVVIESAPVFGFGKTDIYSELNIDGDLVKKPRQDANVFLFFVIVKPGGG